MKGILMLTLGIIFAAACQSSLSEAEMDACAKKFVSEHVRFTAQSENESVAVPEVTYTAVDSYEEDKYQVIVMQVASEIESEEKKQTLVMHIDPKTKVVSKFGDQQLPVEFACI